MRERTPSRPRRRWSGTEAPRPLMLREMNYVANTAFGRFQLSTLARSSVRASELAPIDYALALNAIEARVERLENWLDCAFELEPAQSDLELDAALLSLSESEPGSNELTLHVPTDIWPRLPAPPKAERIAPAKLEWAAQDARLVIADLGFDAHDLAALREDALVLIPGSFGERQWPARVEIAGLGLSMQGMFDVDKRCWTKQLDADGWHLGALREEPNLRDSATQATIGLSLPLTALDCIESAGLTKPVSLSKQVEPAWELMVRDGITLAGALFPTLNGHGFKVGPRPVQ